MPDDGLSTEPDPVTQTDPASPQAGPGDPIAGPGDALAEPGEPPLDFDAFVSASPFDDLIVDGALPVFDDDFGSLGSVIEEFKNYEPAATETPAGVYEFRIESQRLRELVATTALAVRSATTMSWVELQFAPGRLRARSFDRDRFIEHHVPLLHAPAGLEAALPPIAVSHAELARTVKALGLDAVLRVDGPEQRMVVRSHGFERPILLKDATQFVAPTEDQIGTIDTASRHAVPRALLAGALAYLAPFADPAVLAGACGYVELGGGALCSWTPGAVARVAAAPLPNWTARIPVSAVRILPRILRAFPETLELLSSPDYLILRDKGGSISFGIGSAQPLPGNAIMRKMADGAALVADRDRFLIPTSGLTRALAALDLPEESTAHWTCAGSDGQTRWQLRTQAESGKRISVSVAAKRVDPVAAQRRAHLPLRELIAALRRETTQFAELDVFWEQRRIRVASQSLPGADAHAILAFETTDKSTASAS